MQNYINSNTACQLPLFNLETLSPWPSPPPPAPTRQHKKVVTLKSLCLPGVKLRTIQNGAHRLPQDLFQQVTAREKAATAWLSSRLARIAEEYSGGAA